MKKNLFIYLVTLFVAFTVIPVSFAAEVLETETTNETYEVPFEVLKDDSDEISATSSYMDNTAQFVVEDGKTYAIVTLTSAAWWQSFKTQTAQPGTFDEDNFVEVEVLSEDEQENTRVVKFEVSDPSQTLNAKIHIVVTGVPGLGSYENSYDIRLKFLNNDHEEDAISPTDSEITEEKAPSTVEALQDGEYNVDFQVLHEQEEKPSAMARYIEAPASLKVQDGVHLITFRLTNNEQISAFQVEQDGEFVDAEVIHVDEEGNTRDVAFEIEDISSILNAKVQVYVAAQNYTGNHIVRLSFDPASIQSLEAVEVQFEDIETSWAKSYIEALAAQNIIQGVSETRFAPENHITRAQFSVLLSRTLELPTQAYEGTFSDVTEELSWAVYEIEAASRAGIVLGNSGEFNPNGFITREQMVTMVIRALEYKNNAILEGIDSQVTFADEASIQDYAKSNVGYAVQLGIVSGIESNGSLVFAPTEKATRAQAAKMIYEMLENL